MVFCMHIYSYLNRSRKNKNQLFFQFLDENTALSNRNELESQ